MTLHPFDKISVNVGQQGSTSFIFTPCPGTKSTNLDASLAQLKAAGADNIITMMPLTELQRFDVQTMGAQVCQQGMAWYHLPVEDDQAPQAEFEQAWRGVSVEILDKIKQQQGFVIHCKGGTGRTGLMAAILMLNLGYSLESAIQLVQSVRPKSLKITPHLDYLKALAHELGLVGFK